MSQSLVKMIAHIVFSTKERVKMIPQDIEPRLFGYISGIINNNKGRLIVAGAAWDHIHLLVSIGRIDIGELIGDIKRSSSVWMKEQGLEYSKFYWQKGYGAFSVSQSHVQSVSEYIRNQRVHHEQKTFKAEFRALCKAYEVEIDERYCWD